MGPIDKARAVIGERVWPFSTIRELRSWRVRACEVIDDLKQRAAALEASALGYMGEAHQANADKMAIAAQLSAACSRADDADERRGLLEAHVDRLGAELSAACVRADNAENLCGHLSDDVDWLDAMVSEASKRLDRIAAKGEASSNGTARLMGKMARGEA